MSTEQPAITPKPPVKSASEYDSPERRQGARTFLTETAIGSAPVAVHGHFTSPFLLRMGATSSQMALLSAITELISVITQLIAPRLVGVAGGRKRMVIITSIAGAAPWAALIAIPFLPDSVRVWAALVLISLTMTVALMGDPAWGSWMSDLVPVSRRGRWMGRRGSIAVIVYIGLGLIGAFALDELGEAVKWGFAVGFGMALVARVISAALFARVKDPKPGLRLTPVPPPWKLVKMVMGRTRLGGFYMYMLTMHFGMFLSAPFFSIYMLNHLGLSYTAFVGAGVVTSVAQMVSMPFWGRIADKKGNYFVLIIGGIAYSIWPVFFIVITAAWYAYFAYVVIGLASAGWAMCHYNFVLENSTDEERPRAVALYRVTVSLGSFMGALLAAWIAPMMPKILTYQIMTMFLVSGVVRIIATAVMLPRFRAKVVDR